jgi:hypothetical protein
MDIQAQVNAQLSNRIAAMTNQIEVLNVLLREMGMRMLAEGINIDDMSEVLGTDTIAQWKAVAGTQEG